MTKLLKKQDVASILGPTMAGVNKLVVERRIPFIKATGSKGGPVRFDPQAIEDWIRSNSVAPRGREVT